MERIDVAFPNNVSEAKVKMIVENFLKNNTDFRCEVNFIRRNGEHNLYMVEYNEPMALYFIGFAACGIEKAYQKTLTDEEKANRLQDWLM